MKLYELTNQYIALLDMAQDPDVESSDLEDMMKYIQDSMEEKGESYAKIIQVLKLDAESIEAEIKRLQKRKTSLINHAERMKELLKSAMEITGVTKIKTPLFTISVQKNPPHVVFDDDVPEEWEIPQPAKVDTSGIMAALKNGQALNFAHLEQGESLRIR